MKTLAKPALLAALVTLIGCPSAEPAAFHASKDIAPTDSLDFLASAPLDIDAITESLDAAGLRAAALARLGPVPPACSPGYV